MYSGYIMQNTEPTNHVANESQAWRVKYSQQTCRGPVQFSCAESGTEVQAAGLPTFLLWKSLIVCPWLWWHVLSDSVEVHVCTLRQVNCDRKPVKRVGERNWIFNQSALEENLWKWPLYQSALQIEIWVGKHGFAFWTLFSDSLSIVLIAENRCASTWC